MLQSDPRAARITAKNTLRRLNLRLGEAEKAHDLAFLANVLHDDLLFRRADGSTVTKGEYLAAARHRRYDVLDSRIVDVEVGSDGAVVTAQVRAAGVADGTRFGGVFPNIRLFVLDNGRWRCKLWINSTAGAA
jgi:hypothetical protein